MKRMIGVVLLGMGWVCCQAQTFAEFFEQKKTQIKYLEEQIAALQSLIGVTEQGYKIVQQGTGAIAGIKQGDVDLHRGYFTTLMTVTPSLRSYPRVNDIIDLQTRIVVVAGQARGIAGSLPAWSGLITGFFNTLLQDCSDDLDWLQVLTTDGEVQMKDEERLQGIEAVYGRMKKRYEDAVKARNEVGVMIAGSGG